MAARRRLWTRRRQHAMFVTGGGGFLGQHLVRHPASEPWELISLPSSALDLRRAEAVTEDIGGFRPQAVVHLAYRRDDRRSIVDASVNVARAARAVGARLIHVSTDLVFAGRDAPYGEADEPDPTTEYGAWKYEAERQVLDIDADALVVRLSLLYGTDRLAPCQQDVTAALSGRSSTTFFTDETRCPTHADDVAAALCRLADRRDVTGVLHLAAEPMTRADFAIATATWLHRDPVLLRTGIRAEAGAASRPGHIVLDCRRADALGLHRRRAYSAGADGET